MQRIARVAFVALVFTPTLVPLYSSPDRTLDIERHHIRSLLDDGQFELAAKRADVLLRRARSGWGARSYAALAATDLAVEARLLNGDGATQATRKEAEEVAGLKQRMFASNDPELAISVENLGAVFLAAGDDESGKTQFDRAVRLLEGGHPATVLRLASALTGLGDAEIRTQRYDAAERTLDRALVLRETALGPRHRLVAQTLERKAYLFLQTGAYRDARPILERALRILETEAPVHADTAALLDTLGTLSWFEGDIADAERFYRRALQLARQTLAAGHPSIAVYQRDLGEALWSLGRISEARDLQRAGLALSRRTLGDTHPEVVWELTDLGNYQMELGEYSEARRLYEEALAAVTTRYGASHLNAATVLHNLALLYGRLGDQAEATRRLEQAIAIWQRVLGPSHPYVGRALDSLAEVFRDQGRYADAQSLLERSLQIREKSLGGDHHEVAESLTKLAAVLTRLGNASEAQQILSRAISIWERVGSADEPRYAAALALAGELQVGRGEYGRALGSFQKALARRVALLGPAHPDVAATKAGLASAMLGLGRPADALQLALEAEQASRDHIRLTVRYLSEHESLTYVATRQRGLELILSTPALTVGAATAPILDSIVRSRALVLDEMSKRRAVIHDGGDSHVGELLSSVAGARERFASLMVRGVDSSRPSPYRELLDDARRAMDVAERNLAEQSGEFRDEMARRQIGLDEVRRSLPGRASLVSFVRYDQSTLFHTSPANGPQYLAFAVAGTARPGLVRLGSAAEIDSLVQQWRREAARGALGADGSAPVSEKRYRTAGAALRRRVWDPLLPFIGTSDRVFIVPDGALNLVSFASLPLGSDRYLAEDQTVLHYLAAERDLVSTVGPLPHRGTLLAMGGPDFDDASVFPGQRTTQNVAGPSASTPAAASARLRSGCSGAESLKFQPLPATAQEADEVGAIWTRVHREAAARVSGGEPLQASTRVLIGSAASERRLKQLAPEVSILHLATHGFFLSGGCDETVPATRGVGGISNGLTDIVSPLLLSGLALAGANRRELAASGGDDGILTAEEVAGLDLRQAEWVVLSACDTGVGEVTVGEGVLGLRRAFRVAGARTLIMSLWSVDDQATRQWMRTLYDNRLVRGLDTAASVRETEIAMLRDLRAAHRSTHPFYWAAFLATGDWR